MSALVSLGPVTWIAAPRGRSDGGGPLIVPDHLQDRIEAVLVPAPTRGRLAAAGRWLGGDLPWPLAAGDWSEAIAELGRRRGDEHRVVWAMGVDALSAVRLAGVRAPVVIVDADLESVKLQRQIEIGGLGPLRRRVARNDVGRWQRLERLAVRETSGFSLCSDDEVRILGEGAFATPNSYPMVHDPARQGDRDRDVLLFVGSLGYRPNTDGLDWFVDRVLPELRRRRPTVSLRVVGSGLAADHRLKRTDGVDIVGGVDDVGSELRRAGCVVVPLRWGAGTRIKILEAFAHRVPVVSTTLGAEGLGLEPGRQLLLADDEVGFGDACITALGGDDTVEAMVERAHRTFCTTYEESVVRHRLAQRVGQLLAAVG